MKEIVKRILEVVGRDDVVFIGNENQDEIKTIRPEEVELYPKKYKNIIVDDLEQLDEEMVKRLIDMAGCLWVLFSLDNLLKKVDSTVENVIGKRDFRNINVDEKIENLKKMSGGNALIVNFDLPEMAVAIPKIRENFLKSMKTEPLSSFFLNLSMVEYLKSKLEETKKEKEKLEIELEMEKLKFKQELEKVAALNENIEKIEKEKKKEIEGMRKIMIEDRNRLSKANKEVNKKLRKKIVEFSRLEIEKNKQIEDLNKRHEEEKKALESEMSVKIESLEKKYEEEKRNLTIKFEQQFKEKEKEIENLSKNYKKVETELKKEIEELTTKMKTMEERYKEELKRIISEMGLKLEEKEEELKRLKMAKES
jgi:hypothetical protein